jgi:hypothetical protein
MGLYAVIKGTVVDCIAIADGPLDTDGVWVCVDGLDPQPGRDWTYENGVFSPPVPPPAPVLPNIITKVAFRFRLTDAEYVGVLNAAKTDVEVAAWVETFNMVTQVNLDSQRTIDGVAVLVAKGLLTEVRGQEILTSPVTPSELP